MKAYKNQDLIRLVVADVDGTLVTQEKVLTAKTKEAVGQLKAFGIAFAITSGRPPRGMQMVIKDVNLTTVVAGFNGGVYTTTNLDPIVMRDLPKGSVVDFLSAVYLIPKSGIVTLGDMPNNVLMFKKSGMSIAMGNASKEVQAEANFVTAFNEEEGFAQAIERFVLPQINRSSRA